MKQYEIIDHTADIQIRIFGSSLEELFVNAAYAMNQIIFGSEVNENSKTNTIHLELNAPDLESLLVDWLSDLLFRASSDYLSCLPINLTIVETNQLIADISCQSAKAIEEIKAVTYHQLAITKKDNLWQTHITFDV